MQNAEAGIEQFRLEIIARKSAALSFSVYCFLGLIIVVGLLAGWWFMLPPSGLVYAGLVLGAPMFFWVFGLFQQYLSLAFSDVPVLRVSIMGIEEHGSILNLGVIPLNDVRYFQIVDTLLGPALQLRIKGQSRAFRHMTFLRALFFQIYSLVYPKKIFIPLSLLKISKSSLESELVRFQEQLHVTYTGKDQEAVQSFFSGSEPEDAVTKSTSEIQKFEVPSLPKEVKAKPFKAMSPREAELLERVRHIKQSVKESGFDRLLVNLFYEEVRNYPKWQQKTPKRIPKNVEQITGSKDENQEVVSLVLGEVPLSFHFQKMPDLGRLAYVKLRVKGKIVANIKVLIEIGLLEPVDIETFKTGPWQESIHQLERLVKERRIAESQLRTGEETGLRSMPGDEDPDFEELRKKFGIDDD